MGVLISVKKYLSLACTYPGPPPMVDIKRVMLERYLSSWTFSNQKGLLTCEEKIPFYANYDSWPIFCIEMTGIIIKYGIQKLLSHVLPGGSGVLPPHLYLQSYYLGEVLKMAVNNFPLRWTMHEGEEYGVNLWFWIKIKYESVAKLDPLRLYYAEKIRSLKLTANASLHNYIDWFQGLEILWRAIDTPVQRDHRLATQMVEQI